MQLDQNPFFRKTITPWYDSNFACWVLIAAMGVVVLFAVGGIIVAGNHDPYSAHIWFPAMLGGVAGFLIIKVYLRLRSRARND